MKKLDQVITVKPYDYVIIGSYSKWEKPSPRIYKFVEVFQEDLAKKKVAYFLTCGDYDETMILKTPGGTPHLIAGRNYLWEIRGKASKHQAGCYCRFWRTPGNACPAGD